MKRFESYTELLKEIGVEFSSYITYAENELNDFLERNGSDIVKNENEEPACTFKIEIERKEYEIGITALEIEEDEYKYFYWLEEN